MKSKCKHWGNPLIVAFGLTVQSALANEVVEALEAGKTTGDFRLRYENVEQGNPLTDADALTLRTRLTYGSEAVNGFSALLEMEDVRVVGGIDGYTVGPTGFKLGERSVIADPETTELDQAFLQYKNDLVTIKAGRRVITYGEHRFIGHVGWRQDYQTFDGLSATFAANDQLTINYSYINQRNRIFAEAADLDSNDHLLNGILETPVGELAGYAYLLKTDNAADNSLDTYGLRFSGSTGKNQLKFLYAMAFAAQESETTTAAFEADYWHVESGVALPLVTIKLGHERLGSDDGDYGFSTPLATLHKFNGWADIFVATPAQGLADTYLSIGGSAGKGSWTLVYHAFEADQNSASIDDFGDELDVQLAWPFTKNLSAGLKYATYSAGDTATGLVDTDKLWVWSSLSF